jgi:hypothetical protein
MKILFLVQTARINKRGLASIRARITLNKSRKEFSTESRPDRKLH